MNSFLQASKWNILMKSLIGVLEMPYLLAYRMEGFFPLRNTEKKRCKEVIQAGKGVLTNKRTDVFAPVLEKKHADQLEETCRGHFTELPTANDAFYLITQN